MSDPKLQSPELWTKFLSGSGPRWCRTTMGNYLEQSRSIFHADAGTAEQAGPKPSSRDRSGAARRPSDERRRRAAPSSLEDLVRAHEDCRRDGEAPGLLPSTKIDHELELVVGCSTRQVGRLGTLEDPVDVASGPGGCMSGVRPIGTVIPPSATNSLHRRSPGMRFRLPRSQRSTEVAIQAGHGRWDHEASDARSRRGLERILPSSSAFPKSFQRLKFNSQLSARPFCSPASLRGHAPRLAGSQI